MGNYVETNYIILALIFLPLLSCAPLKKTQEKEDPDLYRNVVFKWLLITVFCDPWCIHSVIKRSHSNSMSSSSRSFSNTKSGIRFSVFQSLDPFILIRAILYQERISKLIHTFTQQLLLLWRLWLLTKGESKRNYLNVITCHKKKCRP